MTFRILASILALAAVASQPLIAAKSANYAVKVNPKFPGLVEVGTIGVLNFNGQDGSGFADALAAALQSAQMDGRPVFQVKTLDSMNYRSTADLSKAEVAAAIRLGQKLGVGVVLTGSVASASVRSENYTNQESVCLKSKGLFKCEQSGVKNVPCTRVSGQYSVAPRAIRVANGALIYSRSVASEGEYRICNGQLVGAPVNLFGIGSKPKEAPVSTPEGLLQKLRTEAAQKILLDVAPSVRNITVSFMDKSGKFAKPDGEQFDNALAFAGAARLDRACAIFETIYVGENQSNVSLLYNMGACQEVLVPEDPAAALAYYAKADQALSRPNKQVSEAFMRVRAAVEASRKGGK